MNVHISHMQKIAYVYLLFTISVPIRVRVVHMRAELLKNLNRPIREEKAFTPGNFKTGSSSSVVMELV